MSEGKRPGGLTALAVLNFVFGGFGALGLLFWAGILVLLSTSADLVTEATEGDEDAMRMVEFWRENTGVLYTVLATSFVAVILQITSGVGYLQQKNFLGRTLGNGFAVLSIASSMMLALSADTEVGGGFQIATIVGLIYPGLTLLLLNTTFKEDFIR